MAQRITARQVIDRLTDGITSQHADKWGEAMGAHFTIAYALDERDAVPASWQFRTGMTTGLDGIENGYTRRWIRMVRTETLQRAGDILERYENALQRAGLDY